MKINNNPQTSPYFGNLTFRKVNGIKLFEEFHCKPKRTDARDYFVRITSEECFPDELCIKVDNNNCSTIGACEVTIENKDTLFNENMEVFGSNKRHGAGTAIQLATIATMFENGLKKIKLYSLAEAVHFHSKFKFEPKITELSELEDAITRNILIHDGDGMIDNAIIEAKEWLNNDRLSKKAKITQGNRILYEYLQRINASKLNEMDEFQTPLGFTMELTKKKILENKDFYNELFKKFNIDYQI